MSALSISWGKTWSDLALVPPSGLLEHLLDAYQEPQRAYHSLQHLAECISLFEEVRNLAKYPGEVAIALWFHDAIYNVKSKDNERQSCNWALRILRTCGANQPMLERVENLIMATKHDVVPVQPDEQLLVDIDLAILGAAPQRFAEYDQQVRIEYSWVPSIVYKIKRHSILTSFLARPNIYNTPYFRKTYESQARLNLAAVA